MYIVWYNFDFFIKFAYTNYYYENFKKKVIHSGVTSPVLNTKKAK